ncbi:hypothetical protein [Egicoccus halophilus]|uniref:Uncharacterized protein n=1 Tax=Egicoccus halophilus TaxID=1670830 RepID=A0A8J3ETJ4_9ACTN|nr:hypothetical protein [Egicoccus halophilus]GGI05318.1 hypothetical protein GCM10011354_13500 [Egicoccus halophilus]
MARASDSMPMSPARIRCSCGAILADSISGRSVVIDGVEYQFRRRNDRLVCPDCGIAHPMKSLRPDNTEGGADTLERRRRGDRATDLGDQDDGGSAGTVGPSAIAPAG